jgi:hypothetical protein
MADEIVETFKQILMLRFKNALLGLADALEKKDNKEVAAWMEVLGEVYIGLENIDEIEAKNNDA